MNEKIKIVAVTGPTASGKTALAIELAKRLDGEIISCDSMQIYKGMDIGTAKVTEEETQGVPHHLIDIVSPESDFSCAEYSSLAKAKIEEIVSRGKTPIFCGGTGLYLDSVLTANTFSEAEKDESYRAFLETKSVDELHAMLTDVDPESAEAIHKNNVKRVIRALEIFRTTGVTKTEWDKRSRLAEAPYDSLVIGLNFRQRETLYQRINLRVDLMLEAGLLDEVKKLDTPAFRASTASDGIGYKEILRYTDGLCTLEEAVEEIKKASRNYAKRQITWFARNKSVRWIYPDDCPQGEDKFKFIVNSSINIINNKENMLY
jgi:tRNA dimethylallyltransferase